MSRRFQIVLSESAAEQLCRLAEFTGQPPSTLAAELVRDALTRAAGQCSLPPDHHASETRAECETAVPDSAGSRAPWLEPYGGNQEWRVEMWAQIVALHGRYPRHLARLKDGWWEDDSHSETLCALAVWRVQLDETATNPREELDFQGELANYAQVLRAEGGGVSKAWQPGAAPVEWLHA